MRTLPRLLLAAALGLAFLPANPASAASSDRAAFARWTSTADFARGTSAGLAAQSGKVTLGSGTWVNAYNDPRVSIGTQKYDRGDWISPWQSTSFPARTLIPSWSIKTPDGTWARIEVRVRSGSTIGSWDSVARYASGTTDIARASYSAQPDDLARVSTDTVIANSGKTFDGWQVRVRLLRRVGDPDKPTLYAVNGVASSYLTRSVGTSTTTMTTTTDLPVPGSSQMIHRGEYPQWGGGGEAWCSPTSTSMIMRYYGRGPTPQAYAWTRYADGFVDHAARYTFDHKYDGTGNWSFNTTYAGRYSLVTSVTRLYSLREAESFIKAGIPLVASVAYGKGGMTGAPISSTPGHLMVIRGFTSDGRVIVNDPAAPKNSTVRRVYSRSQFEKAWLGGSGGVVYVMRTADRALPKDTARW